MLGLTGFFHCRLDEEFLVARGGVVDSGQVPVWSFHQQELGCGSDGVSIANVTTKHGARLACSRDVEVGAICLE